MGDRFVKIAIGNGRFKNVLVDDIFCDSDSGDETESAKDCEDRESLLSALPLIIEPEPLLDDQLVNEVVDVIPNELETEQDPDSELDRLLAEFNSEFPVPGTSSAPDTITLPRRTRNRGIPHKERSPSPKRHKPGKTAYFLLNYYPILV